MSVPNTKADVSPARGRPQSAQVFTANEKTRRHSNAGASGSGRRAAAGNYSGRKLSISEAEESFNKLVPAKLERSERLHKSEEGWSPGESRVKNPTAVPSGTQRIGGGVANTATKDPNEELKKNTLQVPSMSPGRSGSNSDVSGSVTQVHSLVTNQYLGNTEILTF